MLNANIKHEIYDDYSTMCNAAYVYCIYAHTDTYTHTCGLYIKLCMLASNFIKLIRDFIALIQSVSTI